MSEFENKNWGESLEEAFRNQNIPVSYELGSLFLDKIYQYSLEERSCECGAIVYGIRSDMLKVFIRRFYVDVLSMEHITTSEEHSTGIVEMVFGGESETVNVIMEPLAHVSFFQGSAWEGRILVLASVCASGDHDFDSSFDDDCDWNSWDSFLPGDESDVEDSWERPPDWWKN